MKRHGYIIKMNKPCNEDWTSMTTNELGKFCSNCSKNIVDFTELPDDKVFQIIEQTNGNLCGRFKEPQLNRLLISNNEYKTNKKLSKLVAGLLLLATSDNSIGREQHSEIEIVSQLKEISANQPNDLSTKRPLQSGNLKNAVHGRIIDEETKKPLSTAKVKIKGTEIGVFTDMNGQFEIIIPDSLLKDQIVFQIITNDIVTEFVVAQKDLPLAEPLLIFRNEADRTATEGVRVTLGSPSIQKINAK